MTQNDIAFYSAKASKRDARLKRRETKRHDLETEQLQKEANVANLIGAEARMIGAQASAKQADVAQERYELEWETEYGWPYGTDPDVYNNTSNYHYLDNDPSTQIVVPNNMFNPQSYLNKVRQEQKTKQEVKNLKRAGTKTIFDIFKEGGETAHIIQSLAN